MYDLFPNAKLKFIIPEYTDNKINEDRILTIDADITRKDNISTESVNQGNNDKNKLIMPLSIKTQGVNEQVKILQQKLNQLGYTDAQGRKLVVDGQFGNNTLAAVNLYKEKNNIANTGEYRGVVGNTTWEYLLDDKKIYQGIKEIEKKNSNIIVDGDVEQLINQIEDKYSKERIRKLHPKIQVQAAKAIIQLQREGINARITQDGTYRTIAEQEKLYEKYLKGGPRAAAPWKSYHNYGLAVDVALIVNSQMNNDPKKWNRIGEVFQSCGFVWGRSFGDTPHFEMSFDYSEDELRQICEAQGKKNGGYPDI